MFRKYQVMLEQFLIRILMMLNILSFNDALSRCAWLVPLESKHNKESRVALETLFEK